jgi:hypothetical protein
MWFSCLDAFKGDEVLYNRLIEVGFWRRRDLFLQPPRRVFSTGCSVAIEISKFGLMGDHTVVHTLTPLKKNCGQWKWRITSRGFYLQPLWILRTKKRGNRVQINTRIRSQLLYSI